MVILLQLFLLLPLIQPITNRIHGNSGSSLPNHSKHNLVSYRAKSQTDASGKKKHHGLAGNAAVEIVRPLSDSFCGKSFIISNKDANEQIKSKLSVDTLSAKPSHTDIKEFVQLLGSPKNRVKRRPTHTDKPPQAPVDTVTLTSHSTQHPFTSQKINLLLFHRGETVVDSFTDGPLTEFKDTDLSAVGSGDVFLPAENDLTGSLTDTITSAGKQHAQYKPQVQTAFSVLATPHTSLTTSPSLQISLSETAPANRKPVSRPDLQATSYRIAQWGISQTQLEIDALGTTTPSVIHPKRQFTTLPSYSETTTLSTSITNLQIKTSLPDENSLRSNYLHPKIPVHSTTVTISNDHPKGAGNKGAVNSTTDKMRDSTTVMLAETNQKNTKGMTTLLRTTPPHLTGRGHFVFSKIDRKYTEKDPSISSGMVPSVKSSSASPTPVISNEPCVTGIGPCDQNDVNKFGSTNGSKLVWADLHRTLSYAWELHVFGSAAFFLLLTAGAALGLALAHSMHCPHRGELVLTNSLLLVACAVRTGHFLLDPYGTRLLLPPPVIIALYMLPLPLFILAQTTLMILVLKEAGVTLLPPALHNPPLLGVLAVLQCTILLPADLLSPALSPAVPAVLQSLTLTAGLALCFGYLFLALPRLAHKHAAQAGNKGMGEGKLWVIARVLAVCALLGALCCLLHVYACLWLYGLLGDWRHFRWGWWLCHFCARLLELSWVFCLLLMSSRAFWRPISDQTYRASRQDGAAMENLPSPSPSSNSTSRRACWVKIVQSLKVRQQRKSESNGNGGSNSDRVVGELPNNWVGQERSGADISKSLIRNCDPLKDSNQGSNLQRGPADSLLRLQALAQSSQCSLSNSLDRDKESAISLYDFDLRPPTPIDLSRSIDEALHREHLLRGGSLFQPLRPPSPPSPRLWMRRNSDPQITLSLSSDEHTLFSESSAGLDRCIPSAVPSRQVTAPSTPTYQGFRWVSEVPAPSFSCPVSLNLSPNTSFALVVSAENTRPFLTPDIDSSQSNRREGHGYLNVNQQDDSVSSDIIDL